MHDHSILFYIDDAETGTPLAARKEDIVLWQKATGKGGIKNVAKLVADKHRDKVTYEPYQSKVELTAEAAEAKFVEALRKYISNGKKVANGQPFRAAKIPHVQFCAPDDADDE